MPVAIPHLRIGERAEIAASVDTACFDKHVFGFAAMGAGIHAQSTPERTGNAAIKCETVNPSIGGGARKLYVGNGSAGAQAIIRLCCHFAESSATETNDDTRHAADA